MMPNLTGVKALSLMPSLPMKKETLSFLKVYFENTYFIIPHHILEMSLHDHSRSSFSFLHS